MKKNTRFSFGPAVLVTAAFIGPGTVMTASKAGSQFGFMLLWAIAFSAVATIVLQEMAARLGIVTGVGLSQALQLGLKNRLVRICLLGLVLLAILVGNSAYQTGNILGAASGVKALVIDSTESAAVLDPKGESEVAAGTLGESLQPSQTIQNLTVVVVALLALVVIWMGRFKVLQGLLTGLVALMSGLFIYSAVQSGPDWGAVLSGFVPRIPSGGEWIVIAIIGTTVVPYNLFLHASAAAQQWQVDPKAADSGDRLQAALVSSRWDTLVSVALGGLVTCAILVTASIAFHSVDALETGTAIHDKPIPAHQVALQLEPALGKSAKLFFAFGLFAAGLTSAITAPIAAGLAVSGCFGWSGKLSDWRLKATATGVMLFGVVFAVLFGKSPVETIILAQVANGLLLPIIAILLLWIVNRSDMMKTYQNGFIANALGVVVILVALLIAVRQFNSVAATVYEMF